MSLQSSLASIENWPVPTAAAAVVRADGAVLGSHGPVDQRFALASVTKPLAAYAALVAYEEGRSSSTSLPVLPGRRFVISSRTPPGSRSTSTG